jgi:WD40 repeat protein
MDVSPDGRRIAVSAASIKQWDAQSGEDVGPTMAGHDSATEHVDFTPDGRRVFLAAKNMPVDGGSSSVGGGIWQVPAPAAWADALCEKLTTNPNPNQEQWNEWISSDPEIARAELCPGAPIATSEP